MTQPQFPVEAIGHRMVRLADPVLQLTFPLVVLYPAQPVGAAVPVGPFGVLARPEAPPLAGEWPLVLLSHGSGGGPWLYRTLAVHLAHHGFVVGLPEHPFNNRTDNSWFGKADNLAARPRHLGLALDYFFGPSPFASFLKPAAVGLIGHSMGGYSVLALAGGEPTAFPVESPSGQPQPVAVVPDDRVRALVLLAPATVWFKAPGALRNVRVPIQLWQGGQDTITPAYHVQLVLNGVADKTSVEYRLTEEAGHYSFLSPFPAALINAAFLPSQDIPGFDRPQFHETMNTEITAFLRKELF